MFPDPMKSFGGLEVKLQVRSNDSSMEHPLSMPKGYSIVKFPHCVRQPGFAVFAMAVGVKRKAKRTRMIRRSMFLFSCVCMSDRADIFFCLCLKRFIGVSSKRFYKTPFDIAHIKFPLTLNSNKVRN